MRGLRNLIEGKLDICEQIPPIGLLKCTFEYILGYGLLKTGIVFDIYLAIVDRSEL
jgi:hypothetical protein